MVQTLYTVIFLCVLAKLIVALLYHKTPGKKQTTLSINLYCSKLSGTESCLICEAEVKTVISAAVMSNHSLTAAFSSPIPLSLFKCLSFELGMFYQVIRQMV